MYMTQNNEEKAPPGPVWTPGILCFVTEAGSFRA